MALLRPDWVDRLSTSSFQQIHPNEIFMQGRDRLHGLHDRTQHDQLHDLSLENAVCHLSVLCGSAFRPHLSEQRLDNASETK